MNSHKNKRAFKKTKWIRNEGFALLYGLCVIGVIFGIGAVIGQVISPYYQITIDQKCEVTCNELNYTYLKAVHQPFDVIDCWCQKENGEPIQVPGIGSNGK